MDDTKIYISSSFLHPAFQISFVCILHNVLVLLICIICLEVFKNAYPLFLLSRKESFFMAKANPFYLALNLSICTFKGLLPSLSQDLHSITDDRDIFTVPCIHVYIIISTTLCYREQKITSILLTTICPVPVLKRYSNICRENKGLSQFFPIFKEHIYELMVP